MPLPYCNDQIKSNCRKCPSGGECNGLTVNCPQGYVLKGDQCVLSSSTQLKLQSIKTTIETILRKRMGDYLCSNLTSTHVTHPFVSRTELEEALHLNKSDIIHTDIDDYSLFIKSISSLPCYKVNASSIDELSQPLQLNQVICDHKIDQNNSILNEEYFVLRTNPIYSYQCRAVMYLEDHKDAIYGYLRFFIKSILIIGLGWFLVICVDELSEMKTEIYNILKENSKAGATEVNLIKKQIITSGNRQFIARLLWNTIEKVVEKAGNVFILGKLEGDHEKKYWKWIGNDYVIYTSSRRPFLKENVNIKEQSKTVEFHSYLQ